MLLWGKINMDPNVFVVLVVIYAIITSLVFGIGTTNVGSSEKEMKVLSFKSVFWIFMLLLWFIEGVRFMFGQLWLAVIGKERS